jgi:hypothetical protein
MERNAIEFSARKIKQADKKISARNATRIIIRKVKRLYSKRTRTTN